MSASDLVRRLARRLTARPPADWTPDWQSSLVMHALVRASAEYEEMDWFHYAREWLNGHAATYEPGCCGTWGLGRLAFELSELSDEESWLELGRQVCEFILLSAPRSEDGLLFPAPGARLVVADSLYFSAPTLAMGGRSFDDGRLFDDAARQLFSFAGHAQDAVTNLFYHCWDPVERRSNEVLWARANGWVLNALVDTLICLPFDHPRRRGLLGVLTYAATGLDVHQNVEGFWHTLLDDKTSPIETSATALITAALARSVELGLIEDAYRENAHRGWKAIQSKVSEDGYVADVSAETGCGEPDDYRRAPTGVYPWGAAAVMMAAAAVGER